MGPYGVIALLAGVVAWQNKKIDTIRVEQNNDTKTSIAAVAKALDSINTAQERMHANTEASKELLAVVRAMVNKGQVS